MLSIKKSRAYGEIRKLKRAKFLEFYSVDIFFKVGKNGPRVKMFTKRMKSPNIIANLEGNIGFGVKSKNIFLSYNRFTLYFFVFFILSFCSSCRCLWRKNFPNSAGFGKLFFIKPITLNDICILSNYSYSTISLILADSKNSLSQLETKYSS